MKIKHHSTQEVVIAGWKPGNGRRAGVSFKEQIGDIDPEDEPPAKTKGGDKSMVAIEHSKLPSATAATRQKHYWGDALARLKALRPDLTIIARAHSDAEVAHLLRHGADGTVMAERELAHALAEMARAAKEHLDLVQATIPVAGAVNPQAAGQIMTTAQSWGPYPDQMIAAFCR